MMIETYLLKTALIPVIAASAIILGLLYKGIDRILAARMQGRIGPPVTQPFLDIRKLLKKESIVPRDAVGWLFNMMPVMALVTSLAILLYLPFMGFEPLLAGEGDLILVLYLLIFPSLALVLGGFSSGSPYANVGAQREMVNMLSYEFPLAISLVSIAWMLSNVGPMLGAFSLAVISANPVWAMVGPLGAVGMLILFVVMLFVMPGKLGLAPFDVGEAETELAGGVLVEYSGRNLALFYLANAVKTIAFGSIIIALFLPGGISGILGLGTPISYIADSLFFLCKLFVVIFAGSIFIRVAVARLRISQVVRVYWGYTTLIAIIGLVLMSADVLLRMI